MREKLVALDGRGAAHAQLLLDAVQELLCVRGEDNLLAVEQTVLEEGTPDAIAMVVVYRIDDVIEDDHGQPCARFLASRIARPKHLMCPSLKTINAS